MNVLFIFSVKDSFNSKRPVETMEHIQMGISHISALLKSKGHRTELLVLTKISGRMFINKSIKKFQPGLICFTAVASEYDFISEAARYIKEKYPGIFLVIGGAHASLNPDKAITDFFDAVCVGEGEYPTLEIVEQLEQGKRPRDIKNIWFKINGVIEKNSNREFIADLDRLPFPDRDIWLRWIARDDGRHAVLLGRGCPFKCPYCCNESLKKLSGGMYVRFRSVENILAELKELVIKFKTIREVYFEVETIGENRDFARHLCLELKEFNSQLSMPLSFRVNLRISPNSGYLSLFQQLKAANFDCVNIGLESGSEKIRESILERFYSNEDIIKATQSAKACGLNVRIYVIIGIPGETLNDCRKTIECVRKCQPSLIYLSIFFPYPGTKLYEMCRQRGLLRGKIDTTRERRIAVLDLPEFPKKQIQREFDWFFYKVYQGYRPAYKLLIMVIRQRIGSHYVPFVLYHIIEALIDNCRQGG